MAHFNETLRQRAEALVALYPEARSALIPLCHFAQGEEGYLSEYLADLAERVRPYLPAPERERFDERRTTRIEPTRERNDERREK